MKRELLDQSLVYCLISLVVLVCVPVLVYLG